MKYNGPKVKISRRLGIALKPKAAKIMEKKPYPPGQHGPSTRRFRGKMSVYKTQLLEKQKLRFQYNISEKQMRKYYKIATHHVGNTVDNIIQLLETRLDAVVFRGGLAPTIYAARQYVGHGHFTINGNKVNIPSYQIQVGDVIEVKDKSKKLQMFVDQMDNDSVVIPEYIETDKSKMSTKLLKIPMRDEVPVVCEVPFVIEFYSR
jgi:small subunit ribosomal protein S4